MRPALLLDTHAALWWLLDCAEMPDATRQAIGAASAVHVSAATTWEVAIQRALGKLELTLPDVGLKGPAGSASERVAQ